MLRRNLVSTMHLLISTIFFPIHLSTRFLLLLPITCMHLTALAALKAGKNVFVEKLPAMNDGEL